MMAGHFRFAALIEARERQVPSWALTLATVWPNVVVFPLYVAVV